MPEARTSQISVRIPREIDEWLELRAGGKGHKADLVRRLIEDAMAADRELELQAAFDRAAADVDAEEQRERELVSGAFADADNDESKADDGS